ncbi:hypothetical protein Leryth_017407 [Lithospermum erythrorhizon]|nr:hypothetical protein Leryth_017407 [Lithospermum erythrorhizon]
MGRRLRTFVFGAKTKLLCVALGVLFCMWFSSKIGYIMSWNTHFPSSVYSPDRGGYTVLINTWKRSSHLKQSVAHYASCTGADAIHVVWSESDPPSEKLKDHLNTVVLKKSRSTHKLDFRFDIYEEDNLNNRFRPIEGLRTDAIFSVDDNVIVPCHTLEFAFAVWQTAPMTMVGFVPRMHWLGEERTGAVSYKYGGWWSVWWMGIYSMVLSKSAFFHSKYLELYTNVMPPSIHQYINAERNCEDIAMSLLVANTTDAPPIWVKGKIYEIGSPGTSSLHQPHHYDGRNKCINDLVSMYGTLPLVSTNVKAVDTRHQWFW